MAPRISLLPASANIVHCFATRPAVTGAAIACYIAAVVLLIYAIALQVRLESWVARVALTAVHPAPVLSSATSANCASPDRNDRSACSAEVALAVGHVKRTQRVASKRSRPDVAASEPTAESVDQSVTALLANSSVLKWAQSESPAVADDARIPDRSHALAAIR